MAGLVGADPAGDVFVTASESDRAVAANPVCSSLPEGVLRSSAWAALPAAPAAGCSAFSQRRYCWVVARRSWRIRVAGAPGRGRGSIVPLAQAISGMRRDVL